MYIQSITNMQVVEVKSLEPAVKSLISFNTYDIENCIHEIATAQQYVILKLLKHSDCEENGQETLKINICSIPFKIAWTEVNFESNIL